MELREFVRTSLVEIAQGIFDAQLEASHLVAIAPGSLNGKTNEEVTEISFDVAVTVENERNATKTKNDHFAGKVRIASFSLSGGKTAERSAAKSSQDKSVSRIQFKVPVQLTAWFRDDESFLPEVSRRLEAAERRKKVAAERSLNKQP